MQRLDGCHAVLFDHVRHCNDTQKSSVMAEVKRRLAVRSKALCLFTNRRRDLCHRLNKLEIAARQKSAAPLRSETVAGSCFKFGHVLRNPSVRCMQDRLRERVLALCFQRKCRRQQ